MTAAWSIVLFLCSVLLPIPANAYYCSRPSEPYIPSAYSSDYDRMQRTGRDVEDYASEMEEYVECLRDEQEDAVDEYNDVLEEWNDTVRRFNNQ